MKGRQLQSTFGAGRRKLAVKEGGEMTPSETEHCEIVRQDDRPKSEVGYVGEWKGLHIGKSCLA